MPIYAYKCELCGFAKDVLQKMSDAPLEACPHCEKLSFKKQVTAAGFQLKGSGWYATDFKSSGTPAPAAAASVDANASAAPSSDTTVATKPDVAAAPSAPAATST